MSIKLLASIVEPNTTVNSLVCPECNGGKHKDKSLCITREAGLIKWICFRASCTFRGITDDNPNNVEAYDHTKVSKPDVYDREHTFLDTPDHVYLCSTYGLREEERADARLAGCSDPESAGHGNLGTD